MRGTSSTPPSAGAAEQPSAAPAFGHRSTARGAGGRHRRAGPRGSHPALSRRRSTTPAPALDIDRGREAGAGRIAALADAASGAAEAQSPRSWRRCCAAPAPPRFRATGFASPPTTRPRTRCATTPRSPRWPPATDETGWRPCANGAAGLARPRPAIPRAVLSAPAWRTASRWASSSSPRAARVRLRGRAAAGGAGRHRRRRAGAAADGGRARRRQRRCAPARGWSSAWTSAPASWRTPTTRWRPRCSSTAPRAKNCCSARWSWRSSFAPCRTCTFAWRTTGASSATAPAPRTGCTWTPEVFLNRRHAGRAARPTWARSSTRRRREVRRDGAGGVHGVHAASCRTASAAPSRRALVPLVPGELAAVVRDITAASRPRPPCAPARKATAACSTT